MSARIDSFLVVLDTNIREEDAQRVANLLLQVRGVSAVKPNVTNVMQSIAEERARHKLCEKLLEVLKP